MNKGLELSPVRWTRILESCMSDVRGLIRGSPVGHPRGAIRSTPSGDLVAYSTDTRLGLASCRRELSDEWCESETLRYCVTVKL